MNKFQNYQQQRMQKNPNFQSNVSELKSNNFYIIVLGHSIEFIFLQIIQ
jgi:hypothetical protein